MKACLIPPIPDLDKYVDNQATHHLLLAHLFASSLGDKYATFYRDRAARGDYLIIDNSTRELGDALGIEKALELAMVVGASEIVLSDIRFSAIQTLEATERDLFWLTTAGRDLYEQAGKPALMFVPQGGSFPAWHACFVRLLDMTENAIAELDGPDPVVGVPYAYGHRLERPFRELVYLAMAPGLPVHLLGWPRHLQTLVEIASEFPQVRSVDSSRPFVYAKHGLMVSPRVEYPGRDTHYFFDPIPRAHTELTRRNIDLFRAYAGEKSQVAKRLDELMESGVLRNDNAA